MENLKTLIETLISAILSTRSETLQKKEEREKTIQALRNDLLIIFRSFSNNATALLENPVFTPNMVEAGKGYRCVYVRDDADKLRFQISDGKDLFLLSNGQWLRDEWVIYDPSQDKLSERVDVDLGVIYSSLIESMPDLYYWSGGEQSKRYDAVTSALQASRQGLHGAIESTLKRLESKSEK